MTGPKPGFPFDPEALASLFDPVRLQALFPGPASAGSGDEAHFRRQMANLEAFRIAVAEGGEAARRQFETALAALEQALDRPDKAGAALGEMAAASLSAEADLLEILAAQVRAALAAMDGDKS